MDSNWRIVGLINNYSRISFNFGPTLLYWLEKHKPQVYESIINADKESINNFSGHGSAISQVYNHMIMPLASRHDKETQVKWAIYDFQFRFNRFPEGMWLPETAVDIETLEVLAENDVKFTILSPHQALKIRKIGETEWVDVSDSKIDPRRCYLCNLSSGRSINIFFYDKRTASDIAFGKLLENGEAFAKRLVNSLQGKSGGETWIESVASDGELYGHHHPHGDMTLAYCLYYIVANDIARLTNYSEFLSIHPPRFEVQIVENTSWSCIHGVERWRNDCGDNMGHPGWNQAWRKPLREAMDWLRDQLVVCFEEQSTQYLIDPWEARNDYIAVILNRSKESLDSFFSKHAKKSLDSAEKRRVLKLLEMQRHAMLMYTSCGWFFDEISGIETVQVIMYAARAMQLAKELFGVDLERHYIRLLEQAPSNIPEFQNGAKIYEFFIKPAIVDLAKISGQNTISELFRQNTPTESAFNDSCFKITPESIERWDDGKFRFILNRSKIFSLITLDEQLFSCAAIWLGDHNVTCGVKVDLTEEAFQTMRQTLVAHFDKGQINEIIVGLSKYFGPNIYSLKNLFRDDQCLILDYIVADGQKKARELYEIVYHDNSAMLRFMKENRLPSPKSLISAAEITLNLKIGALLDAKDTDLEQLQKLINDSKHLSVTLDSDLLGFKASEKIDFELKQLSNNPENLSILEWVTSLIRIVKQLPIKLNLWQSQNVAFKLSRNQYLVLKERSDEHTQAWVMAFSELCDLIGIRLD